MRFDTNGKACDSRDIYNGNMGWIPATHECGPWELDDAHPENLAAWLVRAAKENKMIETTKATLDYLAERRAK